MLQGRFPGAVFHIIRVGNNQPGAFFRHIIDQHRDADPGTVSRIHLVDIDHLGVGDVFFNVQPAFVMGLAPPVIVVGPYQEQAEDKRPCRFWFFNNR